MPAVPPSFSPEKLSFKKGVSPKLKFTILLSLCLTLIIIMGGVFILKKRNLSFPKPQHFIHLKGRRSDFIGRQKYLEILYKDLLSEGKQKRDFNPAKVKVLWGKGGYGKSELAIEFANRYFSKFSFVWTFLCDSQENIDQGYWQLAEKLGILNPQDSSERIQEKVHLYLENYPSPFPWLLIYDNLEKELSSYPQRGGAILITSQKKLLHPDFLLEVTPFSGEEAFELIEKITHEKRGGAMRLLVKDLEGIPLLISYAAYYIASTPGCSVADYQKLLSSHILEKESLLWKENDTGQRYTKSLATSWELPLKFLEKENPYALEWLFLCSLLHPEYIREEWVESWLADRTCQDSISGRIDLHIKEKEILKILQNYGIIRYDQKTKTFSIHRFLQHIIRRYRINYLEEDLFKATALLVKHKNDFSFEAPSSWEQGNWWYLHANQVRQWLELHPFVNQNNSLPEWDLYEGIGDWCMYNDRLFEALDSFYKSLELKISKKKNGIEKIYERISSVLFELARYNEALEACNKALEVQAANIQESPLDYIVSLNTKGAILIEQGRFKEAQECHSKSLQLCLTKLESIHIQTGRSLFYLAVSLRKLGQYHEALELHEKASSIYQKTCGKNHPWFFLNLQNKAWIFFDQEKYKEALQCFQQALSIYTLMKDKKQQDIVYSLNGIGWCNLRLGKYKEAKKIFKQALHKSRTHYGMDSRHTLRAYKGLGWSYIKNKKTKKGLKCLLKQLQIGKEIYKNSPRIISVLEDFKRALEEVSKFKKNIEQIKSMTHIAYEISEESLGKDHALTLFFKEFSLRDASLNTEMLPILDHAQQLAKNYRQNRLKKIPIIAIGGCPGVGKTFLAKKLKEALHARQVPTIILKMDDFIKDKQKRNVYKTGWDPRHLDSDPLHQFLSDILKGSKRLKKPILDEVTREIKEEVFDLSSAHLILFEGLYALGSTPPLDFFKYADFGIYLTGAQEDIIRWRWEKEQQKINPKTYEEFIKHMCDWILKDFEQNIAPTKAFAQYILSQNSSHSYKLEEGMDFFKKNCVRG